jgi:calcium channel MID1
MIGYAAPLRANSTSSGSSPAPLISLPDTLETLLTTSLQAFSTSLLTIACGRDFYSHVSSCLDCFTAYRNWLCRSVIPQCASTATSNSDAPPAITTRTVSEPRLQLAPMAYDYTELLPCLSTCNSVHRACPAFLSIRCPLRGITANQSYGYVGEEDEYGDGSGDGGVWPASDRWGDRWCNG